MPLSLKDSVGMALVQPGDEHLGDLVVAGAGVVPVRDVRSAACRGGGELVELRLRLGGIVRVRVQARLVAGDA